MRKKKNNRFDIENNSTYLQSLGSKIVWVYYTQVGLFCKVCLQVLCLPERDPSESQKYGEVLCT